MKSLALASAIAILFAPAVIGSSKAGAEPYGGRAYGYVYPLPDNYGYPGYGPPAYPSRVYAPRIPSAYDPERPARSGWRRGQHLPPDFRGEVVSDYARFHLRKPPRGYAWYRDADDYVLAAVDSGLIFEVIHAD